jgi:hypothetical protein
MYGVERLGYIYREAHNFRLAAASQHNNRDLLIRPELDHAVELVLLDLGRETKELQKYRHNRGRNVTDSLPKVAHQLVVTAVNMLSVRRALWYGTSGDILGVGNVEHGRPLLELLVAGLGTNKRVGETVGNQKAGALASVAGVGVVHVVGPLGGSVGELLSAGLVGTERRGVGLGAGEARKGGSRVGGASLEHVGVRSNHDVGHHSARRSAHHKDLGLVAFVLVKGVVDHADYAKSIAVAAVCQRSRVVHIPAVAVLGRLRVDQNEAQRLG